MNKFDKAFEIHSSENFLPNDVYGLFSEIVGEYNLPVEQDGNGVLFADAGFGELSCFKQFGKKTWLKWEPHD